CRGPLPRREQTRSPRRNFRIPRIQRRLDRSPDRVRGFHQRQLPGFDWTKRRLFVRHLHLRVATSRSFASFSASSLCPLFSLDATVPAEHCRAWPISAYDSSSKYRSTTGIRSFGGSEASAACTVPATSLRSRSSP